MLQRLTYGPSLLVAVCLILVLGACGGSTTQTGRASRNPSPATPTSSASGPGGSATVQVTSSNFAFALDRQEAQAGTISFIVTNNSGAPHDFAIRGAGVDARTRVLGQGEKDTLTVDLKPGTYHYYCSVPGHEMLGMKGSFTVRP